MKDKISFKIFTLPNAEVSCEGQLSGGFPHSEQNLMFGVTMLSHGSPLGLFPTHMAAPGRKALGFINQPHPLQNWFELWISAPHTGILLPF